MCQIYEIHFAQCSHRERQFRRCQASFGHWRQKTERKKKRRWFRSLISSFSRTKRDCCNSTTIKLCRDGACSSCSCSAQTAEQNRQAQKLRRGDADEKSKQAYDKYEAEQRAKLEEKVRRSHFQCSICTDEGRNVLPEDRTSTINGGLCCARGLDEYLAQERREGRYGRPLASQHGHPPVTDRPAASRPLRGTRRPTPWYPPTPTEVELPNEPPEGYEKNRGPHESAGINPGLLQECLGMPGMRLSVVHSPRRRASPLHWQPCIDWDQWSQAVQTHHGRYPPPTCPPRKPLPHPPTRQQRKDIQKVSQTNRLAGNAQQRDPRSSIPELEPIRVSPFRLPDFSIYAYEKSTRSPDIADQSHTPPPRPDSRILVPQFPAARFTTARSDTPGRPLRSVVSNLEDSIDETMEFWNK